VKTRVFPSEESKLYFGLFSLPRLPNLTLFPVAVNPLPVMVTVVPMGPEVGLREVTAGTLLVTINDNELLVPLPFVTETL